MPYRILNHDNAIYYSSLTFHRITALYVKHSPSMLPVTYGASGSECEASEHKEINICFEEHAALLFMTMTVSRLEETCSVPDTDVTVTVYMPGVNVTV